MNRRRRAVSSARRSSAWLVVAGGLVLYSVAVVIFALTGISPTLLLPWWIAQAVPPLVYALLIGVCVRPVSVSRWLGGTGLLWAIHMLLGILTAGVVASIGAWSVDLSGVEAFPPPLIPEILWVPLLLIPLRDSIAGHRPAFTGRRVKSHETDGKMTPTPARQAPTATTAQVVAPSSDAKWPQRVSRDSGEEPEAPPAQPSGARTPTPLASNPMPSGVAPAQPISQPSAPRLDETAGEEMLNTPMRISFDRIASQFPAGAFNVPLAEVSASLPEPGHLSIPSRLVLAQLAEGLVQAGWDVIASQIPERLLAVTSQEVAEQLTDGRLTLPLDELVPQVPLDLLTSGGKPVQVNGIERFPAPFQPAGSLEPPVREEPEPPAEWMASPSEWPLVEEADSDRDTGELPVLEDVELDETLTRLDEIEPETASEAEPVAMQLQDTTTSEQAMSLSEPEMPVHATAHPETARDALAEPRTHGSLDVVVGSAEGAKILASSSSSLGVDAAVAVAKLLLPVLGTTRGAWTTNQITLKGQDGALILTPLGSLAGDGSVLVSAVPLGGSLALAEIAALRAAGTSTAVVAARARDGASDDPLDADLLETEPTSKVYRTAASLDALGSIVATTLHIRETGRDLHLFLPPESDVHDIARLACEIDRALIAVGRLGPRFHAAVLRCGARRLIIRMDRRDTADSSIIIVGGETARPGLACRQAEDAALALGVR